MTRAQFLRMHRRYFMRTVHLNGSISTSQAEILKLQSAVGEARAYLESVKVADWVPESKRADFVAHAESKVSECERALLAALEAVSK